MILKIRCGKKKVEKRFPEDTPQNMWVTLLCAVKDATLEEMLFNTAIVKVSLFNGETRVLRTRFKMPVTHKDWTNLLRDNRLL